MRRPPPSGLSLGCTIRTLARTRTRPLCVAVANGGADDTGLGPGATPNRNETATRPMQLQHALRPPTPASPPPAPLLHLPTGREAASLQEGWLVLLWVPAAATDRRDRCDGERGACVGAIGDEHGDALQWSQHASTGVHCRIRRATMQPVGAAAASKKAASGARAANQQRAGGPRQEQLCSPRRNKAHCKGGKQQQQLP